MSRMSDKVETIVWVLMAICLVGIAAAIGIAVNSYKCHSRWSDSGMETSFGPVKGCQIKSHDRWIPEESYRETP